SLVRGFTYEHGVRPVFGDDDGSGAVALQEGGVVVDGEFKAVFVEDGDVGIEHDPTEAHRFDLDGEALAFLALDLVEVIVFRIGDTLDGDVEIDLLGLREGVVDVLFPIFGSGLHHRRELSDPEGSHVAHAVFATKTYWVFSELGLGRDDEDGGGTFVIFSFGERLHRDAFVIKEDLLRFVETISEEGDLNFGSSFSTTWFYSSEVGGECGDGKRSDEEEQKSADHGGQIC
ncbi:MAG: hypothetical protein ACI9AF_001206, partial [Granulosicoccus sp.]